MCIAFVTLSDRCFGVFADVSGKGDPAINFMSYGTTGSRVTAQRSENFHPPPGDDGDLWEELSQLRMRDLRLSKDDPLSPGVERGYRDSFSPRRDLERIMESNDAFEDLTPIAVCVGQFGQYDEAPEGRPGTFRSPSSIDCARDGRLAIVDADSGILQMFARNGDCLSSFHVVGARAACFITDAARGESLAVATNSGVAICDQTGRVDKHLPLGNVVAVAPLRHGGGVFVAAHRKRITICDRYKPTAVLRSISAVRPMNAPLGHPGLEFVDVVAIATTATPRLYMVDGKVVLAVDVDSGSLLQSFSSADTRLLAQPSAVTVDLATGSVLICDSTTHRVMQFDGDVGKRRCVAELSDDDGKCVALAAGQRGPDGHQLVYVVCRGPRFAEVRMYQM